jgi:ADP-ribosylglycohydrolase
MIGAIIGDIAGSRFEFRNYLHKDFELFNEECRFTDDTVCTIAVADGLLKGIPFGQSLHNWCCRYSRCGYGSLFLNWLYRNSSRPYGSFGNGSAMRVSPCAWVSRERDVVLETAKKSAECTHNHPEGIKGAVCIADCIYLARTGHTKEKIKDVVIHEYHYDLNMTCDSIRKHNPFNATCQVTVPQAIVCFLEGESFEDVIRSAVSIGSDSDTIAAIAGSIAEAFYGIPDEISEKALQYLNREITDVIEQFFIQYKK